MSVPAEHGDMGATATDKQYMIELVGLPQTPLGIPHTCTGFSEIGVTVSDGASTSLTSTTSCQIPVGLIVIELVQNGDPVVVEPTPAKNDNFSGAFFIESNVDVTFKITIAEGAPVLLDYDFDLTNSGVAAYQENITRAVTASDEFTHTVKFESSGTFTVRVTGTNKHSVPLQPSHSEVTVTVQHPVTADWTPRWANTSNFLAVVTGALEPAEVVFEMLLPSSSQLPTDAHMEIDFGDNFDPKQLLLSDSPIK